jgi:hypothetical protein
VLTNEVSVFPAFNPSGGGTPDNALGHRYRAIWDTGATNSVITPQVAAQCSLAQIGVTRVSGVNSSQRSPTYLIALGLPNRVLITPLRVSANDICPESGCNVLIGMDVISQGDFAVSNFEGHTNFTFRMPSAQDISFVKGQGQAPLPRHASGPQQVGRNDPCPCGSGKKYKHCCGKNL